MSTIFHDYINTILHQIDGTQAEKADIYEELLVHLKLSCEDWMKSGLNKEEAEQMAIQSFGGSYQIGNQMQEAMFPYRKIILLVLAMTSLFYSFTIYLTLLFSEGNAYIGWLVASVVTSSLLLLFALQTFTSLDRKGVLNSILILHIFVYLLGAFFPSSLSIIAWFILLLSIVLVYRTTIFDYQYKTKNNRSIKILHTLNISFGLIISAYTLFFTWAMLAFSDTFERWMLIMFIPIVVWGFAYTIQIMLVRHQKIKIAYIVSLIPFIIVIAILLQHLLPFFGIGVF